MRGMYLPYTYLLVPLLVHLPDLQIRCLLLVGKGTVIRMDIRNGGVTNHHLYGDRLVWYRECQQREVPRLRFPFGERIVKLPPPGPQLESK